MSTILDALKKSEQERKLNHVPTLSDMPVPQESSPWPLYIIAVLSLLLALVAGALLSPRIAAPKPSASASQAQAVTPIGVVSDKGNAQRDNTPGLWVDDVVVNVVSYSEVPEQRFIMLNGKMYRENDYVRTGLKIERIKTNAVVLNVRGELITISP